VNFFVTFGQAVSPLALHRMSAGPAPRSRGSSKRAFLPVAAAALLSQGCFSTGYLAQAARGELEILHAARSIPEVAADQEVPPRIARLLLSVRAVKAYGQGQGLKPTKNYDRYADLHRSAAVWVVQACAPLAFDVRHWRFPLVGSIPYLGFFDKIAARSYAESLARKEGLDVYVRDASAFSTLGWFHDPVLSTMIADGEEALGELANIVLHESVHATLYVNNQSAFDESLASFVADRLTLPWLVGVLGPDAPETKAWIAAQARHRARVERLHQAYVELEALYGSDADDPEKRAEKARILTAVRDELRLVRPLNNAALSGYRTYEQGIPAFERLLEACGRSWPRLMMTLHTLGEADFAQPQQQEFDDVIDRLTRRGCAGQGR
jgi:predicted aminopeptidase